jgi:prepilin-type N-terminal cleavage/methylation domain-containing protein
MRMFAEEGLTLVELLMAIAIFGLIAAAATALLSQALDANTDGDARYGLYREGLLIMERMTGEARICTFLLIPNAHKPNRDILAISGSVNEDHDEYFGDPLFPRIDEDLKKQMTDDNLAGIKNVDDDGDGSTDEGDFNDDDEDGLSGEDRLDGIDNDQDGNIDEDTDDDSNIIGMDDVGYDGIDDGDPKDDDEDGTINEDPLNPVIYSYDSGTSTLRVSDAEDSDHKVVLSTRVSAFKVTFETPQRILITLTLTADDGESVTFSEYVHLENTYQKLGKRVR